eukprot:jgi/Ulvmu1/12578/UM092_0008.1
MRIYAGSYERFLFGFELKVGNDGKFAMEQVLSMPAHKNAVKCMATCSNLVVTGGADDQIHLFDMHTSRDMGYLVNPAEGPVPCLEFVRPSGAVRATHILSGSVGGDVCIWKAEGDWELMKTMKGHKGAVNCLAAHPSGRLALSVSRDKQMRLWDLGKGSCAYQAPLGAEGDAVGFFPAGETYFIASSNPASAAGSTVSIHNIQGETQAALPHSRKVLSVAAADDSTLICGCDGGSLVIWDLQDTAEPVATIDKAHSARVRGISAPFEVPDGPGPCIATASSDGTIKVWDLAGLRTGVEEPLVATDAGARFTCVCAFAIADTVHAGPSGAEAGEAGGSSSDADVSDGGGEPEREVRAAGGEQAQHSGHGGDPGVGSGGGGREGGTRAGAAAGPVSEDSTKEKQKKKEKKKNKGQGRHERAAGRGAGMPGARSGKEAVAKNGKKGVAKGGVDKRGGGGSKGAAGRGPGAGGRGGGRGGRGGRQG